MTMGPFTGGTTSGEAVTLAGVLADLDADALRHLGNDHALSGCVTLDDLRKWVRERKLLAAPVVVDGERVATLTFNLSPDRQSFLVWAMGGEPGKGAVDRSFALALAMAARLGCKRVAAWCRPGVARRMQQLVAATETGARPGAVRLEMVL